MNKEIEFKSIDDINDELIRLFDSAKKKGFDVGESCFMQLPYFADKSKVLSNRHQNTILKYSYLKTTNTPAYPSLQDPPADFIDDIMIIEQEINFINKSEQDNAN